MTGKALPNEVKIYIAQAVACFDSPATVVKAVNQEFGITISRQQVEKYDPTKRAGQGLSKKLRAIFEATRKGFIENTAEIGWSHRATRLRVIQRVGEKAEAMGNLVLVLTAAKQAAEEEGNAYTNRRELTGKDGKDLPAAAPAVAIFALPDNGRDTPA
ncbi:DUF2280 domain-containing protein [Novosphingobium sp. BL-8A]|uniref:DUF2280 domain-containing protein n=1 Tax=Novosphingobium sp. BL-8A TaxID=3127639 RepID=UPI003757299F